MYNFIILSLPRSGSHMLASALDSHPEIQCTGEYDMVEKFPMGKYPGKVKGCIVQAYHIQRNIAPPDLDQTKIIRLTRPLMAIAASRHYGSQEGTSSEQHTTPIQRDKKYYPVYPGTFEDLAAQEEAVAEYVRNKVHLSISYASLCRGENARMIRKEAAYLLCDYLKVERMRLFPATYKPS